MAFIEARLGDFPKDNAAAVQRVLYRARTAVRLGALPSTDGEEARALFLAWGKAAHYWPMPRSSVLVTFSRLLFYCSIGGTKIQNNS